MPSASTTWGSLLAASSDGREIRCQDPVTKLSGRQEPCGRLIANNLLVRCRCKQTHEVLDIVAITANRDPRTLTAFLKETTYRFWNDKSVDSMVRYYRSIGQSLPPTFTECFPRWLNNRIDLVHEQGFQPIWVADRWILVEYDPITNEGRWGTGDADRFCVAQHLPEHYERTRHYLKLKEWMLSFPDSGQLWRQANDIREWLWRDENYLAGWGWSSGLHWLHSGWDWRFDPATGRTTRNFDESTLARYEFFVLG